MFKNTSLSWNGIPCKEWIAGRTKDDKYGQISIHGQILRAHIIACMLGNNYIRPEGLEAGHNCGFSLCVEPKHLSFKTPEQNAADKFVHGTGGHKFTMEQVREIRALYTRGEGNFNYTTLAKKYNVSHTTIRKLIRGERYKDDNK